MADIVERLRTLVYQEEWLEEAADEIERLRKGIQDYLDGDYGRNQHFHTKHDTCPHGQFGWVACEACIDAHFAKLLSPADRQVTKNTEASQS